MSKELRPGKLSGLLKDASEMMQQMKDEDMSLDDIVEKIKGFDIRLKIVDKKIDKIMNKLGIEE